MVLQSTYKCNFAKKYKTCWVGAIYLGCRKTIGFYWFNCISCPIKPPNQLWYQFTKLVVELHN